MASQEEQLKRIADQLQGTYEALRKAAANIHYSSQPRLRRRPYNLWALAIWNTRRTRKLASWRGESNVPVIRRSRRFTRKAQPDPGLASTALAKPRTVWPHEPRDVGQIKSRSICRAKEMRVSTNDQHAFDRERPSKMLPLSSGNVRPAGLGLFLSDRDWSSPSPALRLRPSCTS
jgi:hypothetical protein